MSLSRFVSSVGWEALVSWLGAFFFGMYRNVPVSLLQQKRGCDDSGDDLTKTPAIRLYCSFLTGLNYPLTSFSVSRYYVDSNTLWGSCSQSLISM